MTPYAPAGAAGDLARQSEPRLSIRRRRPPEEIEVLMGRDGPTALRGQETTARVLDRRRPLPALRRVVASGPRRDGDGRRRRGRRRRGKRRRARRLGPRILGRARLGRRRLPPAPRRARRPLLSRRLLRLSRFRLCFQDPMRATIRGPRPRSPSRRLPARLREPRHARATIATPGRPAAAVGAARGAGPAGPVRAAPAAAWAERAAPACPGPSDAAAVDSATCTAKFNFESGVQGATIPTAGQAAFTAVATSGADHLLRHRRARDHRQLLGHERQHHQGRGRPPDRRRRHGLHRQDRHRALLRRPGLQHAISGSPSPCARTAATGSSLPTFRTVTASWKTESIALVGDAGVANESNVQAIVLQAFSTTGYQGTIYVDEIDVQ